MEAHLPPIPYVRGPTSRLRFIPVRLHLALEASRLILQLPARTFEGII